MQTSYSLVGCCLRHYFCPGCRSQAYKCQCVRLSAYLCSCAHQKPSDRQCEMLRILLERTLIKAHTQNLSLNDPHRLSAERKIEDGGKESGESLQMLSTFSQLSEYFFRHEFAFDTIPVVLYYILTFMLPIPHDDGKHVNAILAVWWTF